MKKFISGLLIIGCLFTGMPARADSTASITLESASKTLIQTNWDLKKIKNMEYQFKNNYDKAVESAESLGIQRLRNMYLRFLGKSLSRYTEMQLWKVKEYLPEMFKYNMQLAQNNYTIAERGLEAGLRDFYLGVANADIAVENNENRLRLEEKKHQMEKVRYETGYISALDMEGADYNLKRVQVDLKTSQRNRENMVRSLNQFIGAQVDERYDQIVFDKNVELYVIQDLDYYITKGLARRLDIKNIEGKIALDKLEISILEKNDVHTVFRLGRNDYAKVKADLESQEIMLKQAKIDAEKNIKDAYIDIKKDTASLKTLENTIESQEKRLEKMKLQLEKGLINSIPVEEMELVIDGLKDNLAMAKFNLNTKIIKLENASGAGPAYSVGGQL